MPSRNRLRGKSVTFTIEGIEYNLDVDSIVLDEVEDEDAFVSFANTAGEFKQVLAIRASQSTDADALHTFLRENAGDDVDFVFGPWGNTVPSVAQPHVAGTVTLPRKRPTLGGEVNSAWTFEAELEVVGEVTYVTAPTP